MTVSMTRQQFAGVVTRQTGLDSEVEHHNGLCPYRAERYATLGLETQECAWNLDKAPTWHLCGGYRRRKGRGS